MTDTPVLLVTGMGRCGTTMAMTMLDAGGFPVTGPRPSYEIPERWPIGRPDVAWIKGRGGCAVKWIDPTLCLWLPEKLLVAPVVAFMERDPSEQGRSTAKLLGLKSRRAEKALARSIRRDLPKVRSRLAKSSTVYRFTFEDALENPFWFARALNLITVEHFGTRLDTDSAMRVVIPRHPACAPDMRMEEIILPTISAELEQKA